MMTTLLFAFEMDSVLKIESNAWGTDGFFIRKEMKRPGLCSLLL